MHKIRLLAASAVIVGLGTSAAYADPDGFLSGSLGPQQLSSGASGSTNSIDGYTGAARLTGAYDFTPVLGVQGDILLRYDELTNDFNSVEMTSLDAALHAYYREPENFLLGGVVQIGRTEMDYGSSNASIDRSYAGIEAQAFFDDLTAYGQIGIQGLSGDNLSDETDGWFITGELRYFLTPDFKIEAHAGRSELSLGDTNTPFSVEYATVNVGFGLEYKFEDAPISLFGTYDYATSEFTGPSTVTIDTHRVLIGAKFNIGAETLQERDRAGAALKPVDFGTLPVPGGPS
ncbi:outer membrane beta-barrel protein [Devosia sp.]|uniref:outer membrane beta-barrel protein n=1 Tax=Devosia sp. TaxID=1871048 RepID=UPI003A9526BC